MTNLVMLTTRNHEYRTLRGESWWRSVGPELVVVKRWGDAGR